MRNTVAELKQQIADYLEKSGALDAEVRMAWPAAGKPWPLKKAAVAVGIEKMEVAPGALGGYWGSERGTGEPLCGKGGALTLRFDLYNPVAEEGANRLHQLFEGLCDALMLRENPFPVEKLWCGPEEYDKGGHALHMRAYALLHTAFVFREETLPLESIRLVRPKNLKNESTKNENPQNKTERMEEYADH